MRAEAAVDPLNGPPAHPNPAAPPADPSLRNARLLNAAILGAAAAVPVLGRLMSYDPDGRVWFAAFPAGVLPTLCPSRWFGFRCLTCGATRSIIALMHGDFVASIALHRFGWLMLLLIAAQVPYRAVRVAKPRLRMPLAERFGIASLAVAGVLVLSGRVLELLGR